MDWEETIERVRSAAESCAAENLARLRIEDGDFALDIRRTPHAARAAPAEPEILELPTPNGKPPSDSGREAAARSLLRAEFVGIVRLARPLVAPGTVLSDDRELAYVEALGIRNPVRSGGPGRIAEVLVADGEPVDYGQTLFALEPIPGRDV